MIDTNKTTLYNEVSTKYKDGVKNAINSWISNVLEPTARLCYKNGYFVFDHSAASYDDFFFLDCEFSRNLLVKELEERKFRCRIDNSFINEKVQSQLNIYWNS